VLTNNINLKYFYIDSASLFSLGSDLDHAIFNALSSLYPNAERIPFAAFHQRAPAGKDPMQFANEATLVTIKNHCEANTQAVILTLNNGFLSAETLQAMTSAGFISIAWFIDDPYSIDITRSQARDFDIAMTVESACLSQYQDNPSGVFHCPLGFDDTLNIEPHNTDPKYSSDICFVGSPFKDSKRNEWIIATVNHFVGDYKIHILGSHVAGEEWHQYLPDHPNLTLHSGYLSRLESIQYIQGAKINLNIHRNSQGVYDSNSQHIKAKSLCERTFLIAGLGGFQIIDASRPDSHNFFIDQEEIIVCDSAQHLLKNIDYYLTHDEKRLAIAQKSQHRTLKEHTLKQSIQRVSQHVIHRLEADIKPAQYFPIHHFHSQQEQQDQYVAWENSHAAPTEQPVSDIKIELIVMIDSPAPTNALLNDLGILLSSLLERTLQQWQMSILAPFPVPSPQLESPGILTWVNTNETPLHQVVNTITKNSDASWIGYVTLKDFLVAHSLHSVADHITQNPEWQFIYSDTCFIDSQGGDERSSPIFKPDFNLELQRSQHYIGDTFWINATLNSKLGGLIEASTAGLLDLTLKAAEHLNCTHFGHIEDVLFYQRTPVACQDFQAISQVVQNHFSRSDLTATTLPSKEAGLDIQYVLPPEPEYTIIVTLTADDIARLPACLTTLKTSKAGDIHLLCIGVWDDNAKDALQTQVGQSFDTLEQAMSASHCELVILFNPTVQFPNPQDIQQLASYVIQPSIVLACPWLMNSDEQLIHAGFIQGWGLEGIISGSDNGLPLNEPSYTGTPATTQDIACTHNACFMLKKSGFQQLATVTLPNEFTDLYYLPLCEAIIQQNKRAISTHKAICCANPP
jgi:spore maturation protein CgeB